MVYVLCRIAGRIRRKVTGGNKENEDYKNLSLSTKAFKLFLAGKSLVEDGISQGYSREQVLQVHYNFFLFCETRASLSQC